MKMEPSQKNNMKSISKDSPLGKIIKKKPLVTYTPEEKIKELLKKIPKTKITDGDDLVKALNQAVLEQQD